MKKLFTLFAVAVMAFAAQAATLTVAEGVQTNAHYPFYGLYYDTEGTTSQVIYPAEMLTDMVGKQITELRFFARSAMALDGGLLEYSLMIVDQTEFASSALLEVGDECVCGTGAPVPGETEFVITLAEPFLYEGGNLLLQTVVVEEGDYNSVYFYGVDTGLYGSCYQYVSWSGSAITYREAFMPKTTFTYEAGETPVDPTEKADAPNSTKENYIFNEGSTYYNAYTVTLTQPESSEDVNYEIYYRIGVMVDGEYVYGDWMLYTGEFSITEEGTYMVEAYATADGKLESDHIWDGFTVSKMVGVEEMFAGKTVAGVRYFNLAGQEMQQANGMTIVVTTYTDGTTSAVKVMK